MVIRINGLTIAVDDDNRANSAKMIEYCGQPEN